MGDPVRDNVLAASAGAWTRLRIWLTAAPVPVKPWDGRLRVREYVMLAFSLAVLLVLPAGEFALLFGAALAIYALGESPLRRKARLACLAAIIAVFLCLKDRVPHFRPEWRDLRFLEGFFLLRGTDYALSSRPTTAHLPHRERLARFFLWIFFFPTLIAPIVMYRDFYGCYQPWIRNRRQVHLTSLVKMLIGTAKFLVFSRLAQARLTDALLAAAGAASEGTTALAGLDARFLAASVFTVDLVFFYFRFSGLSDITIAWSRLLGFNLYENFNWGLLSRTPVEYWKSANISTYRWLMTHVFFPFWGHRRIVAKVLTTFAVSMLWHFTMLPLNDWQGMAQIALAFGAFGLSVAVRMAIDRRATAQPVPDDRVWRRHGAAAVQVALTFCFLALVNKMFWNGWTGRPIEETLSVYRLLVLGQR